MLERWYYTHDGQRFGPVSTEDLDRLTAEHRLLPTDLLWRMGADPSTAVEAGTVIIALAQTSGYVPKHAPVPPTPKTLSAPAEASSGAATPPVRSAPLPDWLNDVQASEACVRQSAVVPQSKAASTNWVPPTIESNAGQAAAPCPDWLNDLQQAIAPSSQTASENLSATPTG
ncbi:MAG TPA: GYF domain-containing protein, partial [Gemmataceae bacterium]|nr:GYF domain-containing protein [Gemmataceae bacterium]